MSPDGAPPEPLDLPDAWRDAISRILSRATRRVLVLGPPDVGKSTFCRLAARAAASAGYPTALLDTDPGQKTIGPPACVTLGRDLGSGLALIDLAFVGTTDPIAGLRRLIAGAERLVAQAGPDLVLANTSGLLGGPGFMLKAAKIGALKPDLLVGLGSDPALQRLINRHAEIPAVLLPTSPLARRKTKGERRAARRAGFAAYFTGAAIRQLRIRPGAGRDQALPPGLLVGLQASDGIEVGMGLVEAGDSEAVTVRAPMSSAQIGWLVPGAMILDSAFSDHKLKTPLPERIEVIGSA